MPAHLCHVTLVKGRQKILKPLVDIVLALNMTGAGIVSHQSASKNNETLKIPQFT